MPTRSITLKAPSGFRLRTVVFSHGWYDLPPLQWDSATSQLQAAGRLNGRPARLVIAQPLKKEIEAKIQINGRWTESLAESARTTVERMLGLQSRVDAFYRMSGGAFDWAKKIGAGSFLRSTSMFEDAVKMLATTNCSWSLTRLMVNRLIDTLGEQAPEITMFPSAAAMAEQPVSFFRDRIKAGYRADYFRAFAADVANGRIDPESWASYPGSTADLVREITRNRGFGRYSAENLCKLVGRFDFLALDSWCLNKFQSLFGPIEGNVESAIRERYEPYGRWKGLALWLELTRDWHEQRTVAVSETSFEEK